MAKKGRIVIDEDRCKGCKYCEECPQKLITFSSKQNTSGHFPAQFIDPDKKCTACTLCSTVCPDAAITVYEACDCATCDCQKEVENG